MSIIRRTTSVKAILGLFETWQGAISVVEVVRRFDGHMNKTTVYRILERLEQDGMIHSFTGQDGLTWYAKCQDCASGNHSDVHPHFHCNTCGHVECLTVDMEIPTIENRNVDSVSILLSGQCETCKAS